LAAADADEWAGASGVMMLEYEIIEKNIKIWADRLPNIQAVLLWVGSRGRQSYSCPASDSGLLIVTSNLELFLDDLDGTVSFVQEIRAKAKKPACFWSAGDRWHDLNYFDIPVGCKHLE
jgi:hypothetical protein